LEYQTALAADEDNEAARSHALQVLYKKMAGSYKGRKPRAIPVVPPQLSAGGILASDAFAPFLESELIPIGIDLTDAEPVAIDPSDFVAYPILGHQFSGKTTLIMALMKIISESQTDAPSRIWVFDNMQRGLRQTALKTGVHYTDADGFDRQMLGLVEILQKRYADLKDFRSKSGGIETEADYMRKYGYVYVFVDDFEFFFEKASNDTVDKMRVNIKDTGALRVKYFFTATPALLGPYNKQAIYSYIFNGKSGILLGGRFDSQTVFKANVPMNQRGAAYNAGTAYVIRNNDYKIIKTPTV